MMGELTDEIKREIVRHLCYAAHYIVSGELAAYIAEVKSIKPCVVNPSACEDTLDFFQAFEDLRPLCQRHMERWKNEAGRIKKAGEN